MAGWEARQHAVAPESKRKPLSSVKKGLSQVVRRPLVTKNSLLLHKGGKIFIFVYFQKRNPCLF